MTDETEPQIEETQNLEETQEATKLLIDKRSNKIIDRQTH